MAKKPKAPVRQVVLEEQQAIELTQYLQSKPWAEVNHLIVMINESLVMKNGKKLTPVGMTPPEPESGDPGPAEAAQA